MFLKELYIFYIYVFCTMTTHTCFYLFSLYFFFFECRVKGQKVDIFVLILILRQISLSPFVFLLLAVIWPHQAAENEEEQGEEEELQPDRWTPAWKLLGHLEEKGREDDSESCERRESVGQMRGKAELCLLPTL